MVHRRGLIHVIIRIFHSSAPSDHISMGSSRSRITVALCDTCPAAAAGVERWVDDSGDFEWVWASNVLPRALANDTSPDILLLDKSFGMGRLQDWLSAHSSRIGAVVVWGVSTTEAEALRLMGLGVKGILRRSDTSDRLLACFRAVAGGLTWFQDVAEPALRRPIPESAVSLTQRELQVVELIRHGYKNREIAAELGIAPGTVKIHLKHVFEKTGVRGRFGIALRDLGHAVDAAAGDPANEPEVLPSAR